jgi:hypothetical protein
MKKNYKTPISTIEKLAFSAMTCLSESKVKNGPGDAFGGMPKKRSQPF